MSYEPSGWAPWPSHPPLNAQFQRAFGLAQEGGATISECLLVASRIDPASPDSWHDAWLERAERTERAALAAEAAGHALTAQANWLRAATYFRSAEMLLSPTDGRRPSAFASMTAATRAHLKHLSPPGEVIHIDLDDGGVLDAYFIKPAGTGPWPVIIGVGGLDSGKDELVPRMTRAALARGMALMLVDLPGQGESLRLRGVVNRPDTEVPIGRCIDYLGTREDVDPGAIVLYGASLGGVYAARAACAERRLRAVVSDSLVFDLHAAFQQRLALGEAGGDWSPVLWTFGCATPEEVVRKSQQFRMRDFVGHITCPYLIVQGEHDFLGLQTALDAHAHAREAGVDVHFRMFSAEDTGASHCQSDNPTIGQAFIMDWLHDTLRSTGRGR